MAQYVLVEKGYRLASDGHRIENKQGDFIPNDTWTQIEGTMTYKTLSGAQAKRRAILKDSNWGYTENSDIHIAELLV